MTEPTLYQRLRKVALPRLEAYITDLTKHDREICRILIPGDASIYAVRKNGTHFASYRSPEDGDDAAKAEIRATKALEYIDAIVGVAGSDVLWFLVECTTPRRGTVTAIKFSEARQLVVDCRDRMRAANRRRFAA